VARTEEYNKAHQAAAGAAAGAAAAAAAAKMSRDRAAAAKAASKAAEEDEVKARAKHTDESSKKDFFRINLTLPTELVRLLEDLGTTARASGGFKLPKTLIIRSLLDLCRLLKVDVTGVKTEEEMVERLIEAVKRYR